MKLFTIYNRINLLVTIFIFLLAGAAFYYFINFIVISQVDEDLSIEQHEIQTYVREHNRLPESVPVRDQVIRYQALVEPYQQRSFSTAILYDPVERHRNPFRQLTFGIEVNHQWFKAFVAKSQEGSDKLIHSILWITLSTILLILLASFVINRMVLKRLWRPFYNALHRIRYFQIGSKEHISFPVTRIEEFVFMNSTLEKMTREAHADYTVLKEFTENASHEIQTPLAVIRSKLDLLIQSDPLNERQSQIIDSTYNAVTKLTRLNQSLLLLAKIDNQQFGEAVDVDMKVRLQEKTKEFQELWSSAGITVQVALEPVKVKMNAQLADILLNNLLSNATKHNIGGGYLYIRLTDEQLSVSNTGQKEALPPQKLFRRFYKPSEDNNSNGLGLSIIKQICEVSGLSVNYKHEKDLHNFSINWQHKAFHS